MNAAAWLAVLLGWGLLSWLFLGVTRLAAQADRGDGKGVSGHDPAPKRKGGRGWRKAA